MREEYVMLLPCGDSSKVFTSWDDVAKAATYYVEVSKINGDVDIYIRVYNLLTEEIEHVFE